MSHPWREVVVGLLGWVPATTVVRVGVTLTGSERPPAAVTRAGVGSLLRSAHGWSLPSLPGPAPHDRALLALLGAAPGAPTPAGQVRGAVGRALSRALVGLCLRSVVSGRWVELPVMYAADAAGLVLLPGRPGRKRWWRNIRRPTPVAVLRDGRWQRAEAVVLEDSDPGYVDALATYGRRWPRVTVPTGAPLVRIAMRSRHG